MSEDENPRKGTITTEAKTHTLDAPGAVLHYDVRSNDASTQPVLLLIGSPMGAEGFVTQAGHFTDRTVLTYDPRGAGRRAGGHLRQQRRRRQRARPGGQAPGAGPHPGSARAASRPGAAGPRAGFGRVPG